MKLSTPLADFSPWPQARARTLFARMRRDIRPEDEVVTAFRDGQVTLRSNRREDGFTNAVEEIGYQGVRTGDLVIHSMDGFAGAIGVSESDGKASPVVHCYRPLAQVDVRFYAYLLRDLAVGGFVSSLAKGIRERSTAFDAETFRSLQLPTPPLETQSAIADFLDSETARINALINKKQRMIDLLQDRLDAIIRNTVLGHGRVDGPQWSESLGDDRRLTRLGSVLRLRQERNDPIRVEQVLSLTAARGVIPYEEKGDIGNKASEDISRYSIVRVGDIVMNSMNVIIGSVGLSKYEGVLSPVYYILTPVDESLVDRQFLAYHFRIREFQRQLIRLGYGILEHRLRIPWINLKSQVLALPPIEMQRRIAEELVIEEERNSSLAQKLEDQIELLREHRQALITAAVTGQIRIPGVIA